MDVRVQILHLRAQLLWLEGERVAASALSGELRSVLTMEASRLNRSSAILTGDVDALQKAARQEEHSVHVRARPHLAGVALKQGDFAGAARHPRQVTLRADRRWSWTAVDGKGPVAFLGIDSDYARDVELRRP